MVSRWTRSWTAAAATVLALAAVPGAIVIIQTPGVANADVCVSGGRRVSVSGCANIADAVAPYVPPPEYYAPMPYDPPPPPNVTGCVSYNGRWVNASGCNSAACRLWPKHIDRTNAASRPSSNTGSLSSPGSHESRRLVSRRGRNCRDLRGRFVYCRQAMPVPVTDGGR